MQMTQRFPGRIVLGIDAKDGKVATQGWIDVSEMGALDLARTCAQPPLSAVIYTDISRDGMMQGANVAAMAEMSNAVQVPVIASGGVTTLDDVVHLRDAGLAGCIIGRALYEGQITLRDVVARVSGK
jgi:phosphoribosylformimino-5-aminoimidazole carboxamide ribotide isomerase